MYTDIIVLLFAHWVGDYALQTNEMALNKGRNLRWLSIHVAVYTLPMAIAALALFRLGVVVQFLDITFALHWITDFCTTRLAERFKGRPRIYYPIIGFDQFTHAVCLILTARYVSSITESFHFF